jgi:hypothetical protein
MYGRAAGKSCILISTATKIRKISVISNALAEVRGNDEVDEARALQLSTAGTSVVCHLTEMDVATQPAPDNKRTRQ